MRTVPLVRWLTALLLVVFALSGSGCSDRHDGLTGPDHGARPGLSSIPAGYYDTVDPTTASSLRTSLHEVIDDHQRYPYTSTATDTWDILDQADEDPNSPSDILDVYKNASYPKAGAGNDFYNREHSWPNSYGYPNDISSNYPYTDCHALFLCDIGYNSSRGNKPYRYCSDACSEKPTDFNNGTGGGSGVYPGFSNWTSGIYTEGTWETWLGRRGDVARALLYLDVRYEGGTHGVTGADEPDLILTDNEALIAASNTGSNEAVAYMGMLSVLLEWHQQDPVDDVERARNEVVYSYQGNRNPFVDHPEWVECVFMGTCGGGGDVTPPAIPTGLAASAGDGFVDLDWNDNGEADLDGYHVYRSETGGAPYTRITGNLLAASDYTDDTVTNGVTYTYVVTAVDDSGNESAFSASAAATPQGAGEPATVWINEFHYDNKSGDVGEFVEVAGPAGTDLSGWRVYGYNGADFAVYDYQALSGSIPDQQGGYGCVAVDFVGLQNGSPDGIALVDGSGEVLDFVSYEGVITAVDGPAAGMTSVDVGVVEEGVERKGMSLQLTGTGSMSTDFTWQPPATDSPGQPNSGQTFEGGGGGDTTPPAAPTGLAAAAGDGLVDLDWADNGEGDLDGYHVYRADASGGPYTRLTGSLLATSDYTDSAVTNGTTYYYVVTASDLTGNESGYSAEASATPEASGGGGAVHVDALVLATAPLNDKFERAEAVVTVVDEFGAPVEGVLVTGTFTGDVSESASAATGPDGVAVITSGGKGKVPIAFGFCVDDLAKSGWTYDSGANQVTCDSFGAS